MSLGNTISHILRNGEETRDNHRVQALRTRYYRKSKRDMLTTVEHLVKSKLRGWRLVHTEADRGEIIAERRHPLGLSDVVITVFDVSPLRSAVDVASFRRGRMGDFGTSYRNIMEFFQILNREVPPEG